MDKGILIIWLYQLIIMAIFDTRKSTPNLLLNISALGTSLVFTFLWGGIFWLLVPILAVPILAGILGGTIGGLIKKSKERER